MNTYIIRTGGTRLASVYINTMICRVSIKQGIYLTRSYLTHRNITSIERKGKSNFSNLATTKSTKFLEIGRTNFLRMYATETNQPFNKGSEKKVNNEGNKDSDKEKKGSSENEIKIPKGF